MATFKKVFKDVYEDGLKSEGFKYNSKYDYFQAELEFIKELFKIGKTGGTYESQYNSLYDEVFVTVVGARDKVYQDKQLYAEAIAEAERRKMANLEYLRSMKVIE